jgi:predicted KAP-like P-loop ATPase
VAKRVTSKDVVEVFTKIIEDISPNGDLDRMHEKMDELQAGQQKLAVNLHKLEKRLYNPDDGVVVQLNDNTRVTRETRDCVKKRSDDIDDLNHQVKVLKN